jgi:hypothetical protein
MLQQHRWALQYLHPWFLAVLAAFQSALAGLGLMR